MSLGKHNAKATATALTEQKDWHYKLSHVFFYLTSRSERHFALFHVVKTTSVFVLFFRKANGLRYVNIAFITADDDK